MMFKKWCAGILTVSLILISGNNVFSDQKVQNTLPKDIMLIYDDQLTEKGHDNVAAIADILTYMGYGTPYSTISKSIGRLKGHTHILLYHESGNLEEQFVNELRDSGGKIMMVGGGDPSPILGALKLPIKAKNLEATTAQLTYTLSSGRDISGLFNLSQIAILQGTFQKNAGEITAGEMTAPVFASMGRFSTIAAFDSGSDVMKAILAEQVTYWKWPYKNVPAVYAQYIIFDEIYPFMEPQKLMEAAQLMRELGVPYAITVMPIYQNGEYPSMKHFCEVLRYAQANGAAIFLKAPVMNTNTPKVEDINKRISIAFSAYTSYGIYPIALEVPNNWIHEKLGQDVMRRFRTVVLTADTVKSNWTDAGGYNTVYSDGHQFIAPALTSGESGGNMVNAYSTAVFLSIENSIEDIGQQVKKIQQSNIAVKSLWSSSHSVYTEDAVLTSRNNVITLNDRPRTLEFVPFEYEGSFNYNRGIIGQMTEAIARENRRLLILVSVISITFLIFIGIARYHNRKKFLYRDDSNRPWDEEDKY